MARGITENDVHSAADAILQTGERPTVERIRAHLGTGSPNTVTRWLETWWQALGLRVARHTTAIAIPAAPDAVGQLAQQLWEQALAAADSHAQAGVADAHRQVEQLREELMTQDHARETRVGEFVQQAERAIQRAELAEQRLVDLQHAVEAQHARIAELTGQRLAQQERADRLQHELDLAHRTATEREISWTAERDAMAEHVRSVEDRAHAEIDRARQESKDLRVQGSTDQRAAQEREHLLRQQRDEARAVSAAAEQQASELRGRAQALEQQLARLAELPAALEARLSQARSRPIKRPGAKAAVSGPTKRASKTPARAR